MTLRRWLSVVSTFLMFNPIWMAPSFAQARGGWKKYSPGQLRAALRALGTGPEARVTGKLRDKTTVSGYLSQVEPRHFGVMDSLSNRATPVRYEDVKELRGENSANGVQFAAHVSLSLTLGADDQAPGQPPRQLYRDPSRPRWIGLAVLGGLLALVFIAVASDKS